MKTWQVLSPGGLDRLALNETADPGAPGPGEIRVAIKANSLNYHDLLVANGGIPTEPGRIPLSDGAGVVEAVGSDVKEFQVGDSVVSTFFPVWPAGAPTPQVGGFKYNPGDGVDGMATEFVVRPTAAFTHTPRGWSHLQAATITTSALTAWRALVVDGKLRAGETVLTQGTGGVSIAALQIAKGMGARVIVTSSSDQKLERAEKLGADFTINYRQEPEWGKKAFAWAGDRGVDHVIEVGGPATLVQSLQAIKVGGHIALIGVLTGMSGELPVILALLKQARIGALIVGSRQDQQNFVRALEVISAMPIVDQVYPATELVAGFKHLQSARHFGKICIEW